VLNDNGCFLLVDRSTAKMYPWNWCSDSRCNGLDSVCSLRSASRPAVKRVQCDAPFATAVWTLRRRHCLRWHGSAFTRLRTLFSAAVRHLCQHWLLRCCLHQVFRCKQCGCYVSISKSLHLALTAEKVFICRNACDSFLLLQCCHFKTICFKVLIGSTTALVLWQENNEASLDKNDPCNTAITYYFYLRFFICKMLK